MKHKEKDSDDTMSINDMHNSMRDICTNLFTQVYYTIQHNTRQYIQRFVSIH